MKIRFLYIDFIFVLSLFQKNPGIIFHHKSSTFIFDSARKPTCFSGWVVHSTSIYVYEKEIIWEDLKNIGQKKIN